MLKDFFFSYKKIDCDQYRGLPLSAEIVEYWLWPILNCLAVWTKPNSLLKSCTRSVCNCQNIQLYSENWHKLVGFRCVLFVLWSGPWLLINFLLYYKISLGKKKMGKWDLLDICFYKKYRKMQCFFSLSALCYIFAQLHSKCTISEFKTISAVNCLSCYIYSGVFISCSWKHVLFSHTKNKNKK